jgi:hypothetical protein
MIILLITVNLNEKQIDDIINFYEADSLSGSMEKALQHALRMKKPEKLKEFIGKIEFDEIAIRNLRDNPL